MILEYIVGYLVEAILKATILKGIMKAFSFGLFSEGGVVQTMAGGGVIGPIARAQTGLLVPSITSYRGPRFGTDSVPIMATPGEAILPVWLTNALRAVLGMHGSTGHFQAGGLVPETSGGVINQFIIQGNVYANDDRQVDSLIERMSNAVLYRRVPLHASTAGELR
jgi:hypothetical protein